MHRAGLTFAEDEVGSKAGGCEKRPHDTNRVEGRVPHFGDHDEPGQHKTDGNPDARLDVFLEEEVRNQRDGKCGGVFQQESDSDGQDVDRDRIGCLQARDRNSHGNNRQNPVAWQAEGGSVNDQHRQPHEHRGAGDAELRDLESRQPGTVHEDFDDNTVKAKQQRPERGGKVSNRPRRDARHSQLSTSW